MDSDATACHRLDLGQTLVGIDRTKPGSFTPAIAVAYRARRGRPDDQFNDEVRPLRLFGRTCGLGSVFRV